MSAFLMRHSMLNPMALRSMRINMPPVPPKGTDRYKALVWRLCARPKRHALNFASNGVVATPGDGARLTSISMSV